jgi:hypothetical protein
MGRRGIKTGGNKGTEIWIGDSTSDGEMLVKPIWSVKDDGQIYQSLALFYKRRISSMWIRRSSVSLAFLHVFR